MVYMHILSVQDLKKILFKNGMLRSQNKNNRSVASFFTVILILSFLSCTIYDNNLDNPNDNEANEELGVYPPSLSLLPKTAN